MIKTSFPNFEEIFTGSNFKSYKHKYFIAHTKCNDLTNYQKSEVSKIKWMTLEAVKSDIDHQPEIYTEWFKIIFKESYLKLKNA